MSKQRKHCIAGAFVGMSDEFIKSGKCNYPECGCKVMSAPSSTAAIGSGETPRTDSLWEAMNDMQKRVFAAGLERELAGHVEAERTIPHRVAPVCDEHGDKGGGARSGCPYCAIVRLYAALSKIDYLCGEPNDMEVSGFDVHCNEDAVVEHVKQRLSVALSTAAVASGEMDYKVLWERDSASLGKCLQEIHTLRAIKEDQRAKIVELERELAEARAKYERLQASAVGWQQRIEELTSARSSWRFPKRRKNCK